MTETRERSASPFYAFNFEVEFFEVTLPAGEPGSAVALCGGSFSEVTGIEATMEPKVIKEGGRNFGDVQRAGPVTFSTVILKRGVTRVQDAWRWFELVSNGMYAKRLTCKVRMLDAARRPLHLFVLERALPVKFKAAELNAMASAIAVEELHIAHEGLSIERPSAAAGSST